MSVSISITNRQKALPLDRPRIRRAIKAILRDAGVPAASIIVAVIDDRTIAELHGRFLDDPEPTDVLSFVLERREGWLEGEVVASADTALHCAPCYDCSADEELLRYIIHGTLHLVGHDDGTPRQRAAMRRQEKRYLK
jgi:probable rRNA maturation factor